MRRRPLCLAPLVVRSALPPLRAARRRTRRLTPAASTAAPATATPHPDRARRADGERRSRPHRRSSSRFASVANTMTFDKTELTVPAGAEVHLTFKNNATMSHPAAQLGAREDRDRGERRGGGPQAAASRRLHRRPRPRHARAHAAGQAGRVDRGDVHRARSRRPTRTSARFPGHYMMMKGVLTVTP